MNETRFNYSNAVKMLDCVDTLVHYKKYLTKAELTIQDPLNLSRLMMRRVLKDNFGGFNIRKNMTEYALKCENQGMYKALYVANHVLGNEAVMEKLSNTLRTKLSTLLAPARAALTELGRQQGLHFAFKDESRFFIYINFLPMLNYNYLDRENFVRYSIRSRISRILSVSEELSKIKFDEVLDSFLSLFEENQVYNIYHIDREGLKEIDEEFLAYYMTRTVADRRNNIRQMAKDFIAYKKQSKEEEARVLEAIHEDEKPVGTIQVRRRPTATRPGIGLRPVDAPTVTTPTGFRLRAVDAIVEETQIHPIEEEDVEALEAIDIAQAIADEEPVGDAQDIFQRALERIRRERAQGIREFELPALATLVAEEEDVEYLDPVHGTLVTEQSLGLYLKHVEKDTNLGFKTTSLDMYDDIDEDKDGVYYTIVEGGPQYYVFQDSKEVYVSKDRDEAIAHCVSIFGKEPDAIKFFIDNRSSLFVQMSDGVAIDEPEPEEIRDTDAGAFVTQHIETEFDERPF